MKVQLGQAVFLLKDVQVKLPRSLTRFQDNYINLKIDLFILNQVPFITSMALSNDMPTDLETSLSTNDSFKDVTIFAGPDHTEEIKANKFMLSARSEYFARMFCTDMKESMTNCIKSSFEPEICEEIVSYVNNDETPNIITPGMTENLGYAAHMYELPGLQARCENTLAGLITTENAAHLLAFTSSPEYCDYLQELREFILQFITKNNPTCKKVMDSEGWSEIENQFDIVHEVLHQLACGGIPSAKKAKFLIES